MSDFSQTVLPPENPSSPESPPKKTSSAKPRARAKKLLTSGEPSSPDTTTNPSDQESAPSKKEKKKRIYPPETGRERSLSQYHKRSQSQKDYKALAMKRLGLTPEDLEGVPDVTSILKEVKGGITYALTAMRFSDGELIGQFLERWDQINALDRECLTIEAVATAAGIDIRHLWGEIMLAMREHSVSSVKVIAVSNHPAVMKQRIQYAMEPAGVRDRDALDIMLGALPKPNSGTTFIDKAVFVEGGSQEEDRPKGEVDDINFVFPDSELMQEKIVAVRQTAEKK